MGYYLDKLDSIDYQEINHIFIIVSAILTFVIMVGSQLLKQDIYKMNLAPQILEKVVKLISYLQIMAIISFFPQILYPFGAGFSLFFDMISLIAIMNLFQQQILVLEILGRKITQDLSLSQEDLVIKMISDVKEVKFLFLKRDVSDIDSAQQFLNDIKKFIPICLVIYFIVESIHFIFERIHSPLLQEKLFLIILTIPKFTATLILILKFKYLCFATDKIIPTFKATQKFKLFIFIIKIKLLQTFILGAQTYQSSYFSRDEIIMMILHLLLTIELTVIFGIFRKLNAKESYSGLILEELNEILINYNVKQEELK